MQREGEETVDHIVSASPKLVVLSISKDTSESLVSYTGYYVKSSTCPTQRNSTNINSTNINHNLLYKSQQQQFFRVSLSIKIERGSKPARQYNKKNSNRTHVS